jgi:hypothetical protein
MELTPTRWPEDGSGRSTCPGAADDQNLGDGET